MREDARDRARAPVPLLGEPGGYAYWSTRPLHILVFLLPLILLYEVGSAFAFRSADAGAARTIRAERLLSSFFEAFGAGGLYLPGVVLVVVLCLWHLLARDRWRIYPSVLFGMLIEAVLWTMPLLVLGQIMNRALSGAPPLALAAMAAPEAGVRLHDLPLAARATISVGAGLYEELLFRLVAIAGIHAIAADLLRIKDGPSKAIAVFLSAVAFGLYHDVTHAGGGIDGGRLALFTLAGIYFGTVYVMRGFGIVVALHAMYDLAVLVLLGR